MNIQKYRFRNKKSKSVFVEKGTVTAGNSSGLNDGAAALVRYSDSRWTNGLKEAKTLGYSSGVTQLWVGPQLSKNF